MSATRLSALQSVPNIPEDGEASAEWLQSIHCQLVEAFAEARRVRRVEQLLEIAGMLTIVADAARINRSNTGSLMGQPRDPARIPLLLNELDLKVTGLVALGGPEFAAVNRLIGMASSPSSIDTGVLEAIDEIKSALQAA
jgi:hypothetical protein